MDRHNINIVQNTFPWLYMFIVPVFKRKIRVFIRSRLIWNLSSYTILYIRRAHYTKICTLANCSSAIVKTRKCRVCAYFLVLRTIIIIMIIITPGKSFVHGSCESDRPAATTMTVLLYEKKNKKKNVYI